MIWKITSLYPSRMGVGCSGPLFFSFSFRKFTIMTKYRRETGSDKPWLAIQYSDGHTWMFTFEVCQICLDKQELDEKPYRVAKERYSFGRPDAASHPTYYDPLRWFFAGRYCDMCWQESGYSKTIGDATEATLGDLENEFDPDEFF